MPTVINNPSTETGSGFGAVVSVVVILVVAILFFMYALPAIRSGNGGTQINVPDKIQIQGGGDNGGSTNY
jgi:hypothetical protein